MKPQTKNQHVVFPQTAKQDFASCKAFIIFVKRRQNLVFSSNEKEQSTSKDGDLLLEDLSDQHFDVLTNHNLVTI